MFDVLFRPLVPLDITPPSSPVELFVFGAGLVTIVVGLAITYVAFRGYRRNASRPMLFIALGFVLVIALPGTIDVAIYALVVGLGFRLPVDTIYIVAFYQVCQLFGMAAILYALLME